MLRIKTISLLSLLVLLIFSSAFRPQTTASIIGSWTRTEELFINKKRSSSGRDTVISHDKGYSITYTVDSQYHFAGPYGMKADGTFSTSDSMLYEVSAAQMSERKLKIITLTDHKLIVQLKQVGFQPPVTTETITTYTR